MLTFQPVDKDLNSREFLQFVKYNVGNIMLNSVKVAVSTDAAKRCQYNLWRFLKEVEYYHDELREVVLIVNRFKTPRDFNEHTTHVYLPNDAYVKRLLSNHKSTYPKELI